MSKAVRGWPDEIGMERDTRHQRRIDGLLEHLIEIVDDHVRKLLGRIFASHDRSPPADRAAPRDALDQLGPEDSALSFHTSMRGVFPRPTKNRST